jgi:hypothetical protein
MGRRRRPSTPEIHKNPFVAQTYRSSGKITPLTKKLPNPLHSSHLCTSKRKQSKSNPKNE